MAGTPTVAHGSNTFIPSTEATGQLVVNFSKNISKFALPKYVQYTSIKQPKGRYIRMTIEEAGRVVGDNPQQEHYWADGADAPMFNDGRESFVYEDVECHRYMYGFNLGQIAVENAEWQILAQHADIHARKAMTHRTASVISALTTSGNWPTGHYAAAPTNISGAGVTGALDLSTTNRSDIKRTLDAMFDQARMATLDAISADEVQFIVSPTWARKVAVSQELKDHIKHSPAAFEEIKNGMGPNTRYGLPSTLYGYPILVETAVKVTSRKGASSTTRANVWSDGDLVMTSRPGGLEGVEGAPSFSTVQLFLYQDMAVESRFDDINKRHQGRVIDYYGVELTAPISGYYCANTLSS